MLIWTYVEYSFVCVWGEGRVCRAFVLCKVHIWSECGTRTHILLSTQLCASVCSQPQSNYLHSTQRDTAPGSGTPLRLNIRIWLPSIPGRGRQQNKWDPRREGEQRETEMNLQPTRWGMEPPHVLKMERWSSLFPAKMNYGGEGAQCHFLPGTGSAHLELSAVCPLLLLLLWCCNSSCHCCCWSHWRCCYYRSAI